MRNHLIRVIGAACLATGLVASASAAEVLVTGVPAKGGQAFAIDMSSAGDVASFNFKLTVPGMSDKTANLTGCVSELPKGWSGACNAKNGAIYFFATAEAAGPLPAGVSGIGSISVRTVTAKGAAKGTPTVSELFVGDKAGNGLTSNAKVSIE